VNRVLVTAVGGRGIGLQIVKCLRLSQLKLWILGTDISANAAMVSQIDHFTAMPPTTSPDYVSKLLEIVSEYKIRFLFPGSEAELRRLTDTSLEQFENLNCTLIWQSPLIAKRLNDKFTTSSILAQLNVVAPRTVLATNKGEALKLALPVILKPRFGKASEGIEIARSRFELETLLSLLDHRGTQSQYICQEYVPLDGGEFTAGILHLPNGNYFGSSILRRDIRSPISHKITINEISDLPQVVISSGVSQGVFVDDARLEAELVKVATGLGSRGPMNFQFRLLDDKPLIFEINPRFSGSSYLRALAGHNEVETLFRYYLETPLPSWPSIDGRVAVRSISESVTQ